MEVVTVAKGAYTFRIVYCPVYKAGADEVFILTGAEDPAGRKDDEVPSGYLSCLDTFACVPRLCSDPAKFCTFLFISTRFKVLRQDLARRIIG